MFTSIIQKIRDKDLDGIKEVLKEFINDLDEHWEGFGEFSLRSQNKTFVKFLLARMTQYIEEEIGINSSVYNYMNTDQKVPFEIEHLLPDTYDEYKDHFSDRSEFEEYRDKIGGLILLPRGFNQSFHASTYEEKVKHYDGQNILARSLNPLCYSKNPTFTRYIEKEDLPFKPHAHMYKEELDQRTDLYKKICQKFWNVEKIDEI